MERQFVSDHDIREIPSVAQLDGLERAEQNDGFGRIQHGEEIAETLRASACHIRLGRETLEVNVRERCRTAWGCQSRCSHRPSRLWQLCYRSGCGARLIQ